MKVLITRPEDDAQPFSAALQRHGMTPVVSSVLNIEPSRDPLPDLSDVTHLVFTSANGVRAFSAKTEGRRWPVFAVGPATEEAAIEAGFTVAGTGQSSVTSLASVIADKTKESDQIAHITGTHLAGDLQQLLSGLSRHSTRVVCYQALQVTELTGEAIELLREGRLSAATFFSPRSARLFLSLLETHQLTETLNRVVVVCLSQAVADEFARVKTAKILVPAQPNQGAMIDILISART